MKKFENSHTNVSGVFPNTLAVDASAPSATDGFEYIALGINEELGWMQGLLDETGVTPSGNTELAGAGLSDIVKALKVLIGGEKIQPIAAVVAANAMTITLSPTYLDFRSATLGSGAVNNRILTAAISLVISSGSTLGTVNAVESKIAVIAIDNSGTVELAAVNMAGGNNLDETTLISTVAEGGAGAADSDNVFYSNTLRSNVPFKVVGYIESTQATAGAWATAPSTIQGNGGNVNVGAAEALAQFTSAPQTITAAGGLTLPHGLTSTPYLTAIVLKCTTAEHGYSIGDEIINNPGVNTDGTFIIGAGVSVDSTNLNIRFSNNAAVFQIVNKSTGVAALITPASWDFIIRAWA